ncbi:MULTISPECIES: hypothetical protein [unclassified Streptomyces]|uniref:hypothetical protein n=1 Tax=unclassified Streptomyces TaxID=2593676 RepID=UPI001FB03080|nr:MULTISPECIES: hypothetical protein [unclassified Streptomyces]MCJ0873703.1 hypothetical protein [Streptomyces sp. AP-93]WSP39313.1 hypothetical protein OG247_19805 [Streptomyces sp. NBC_01244]
MNSRIRAALTCVGFTAAAVLGLSNPAAAAETAGVWMNGSHSFNIRTSASTSGSLIATVSNTSTRVPCTTTPCTRNNEGGSYSCWSGGPSGNDWVKVNYNGRIGWVAIYCVEAGRI